jgi:cytochrome c peroxidase
MNRSKLIFAALLAFAGTNASIASENGKELFEELCSSCHVATGEPTVAPPIFGVVNHVKGAHPAKEDFVNYIVEWVANPQAEKTLMPGAVTKFGLMPQQSFEPMKVRLVAEYLFDGKTELPEWYIKHYEEEHGHKPKH